MQTPWVLADVTPLGLVWKWSGASDVWIYSRLEANTDLCDFWLSNFCRLLLIGSDDTGPCMAKINQTFLGCELHRYGPVSEALKNAKHRYLPSTKLSAPSAWVGLAWQSSAVPKHTRNMMRLGSWPVEQVTGLHTMLWQLRGTLCCSCMLCFWKPDSFQQRVPTWLIVAASIDS